MNLYRITVELEVRAENVDEAKKYFEDGVYTSIQTLRYIKATDWSEPEEIGIEDNETGEKKYLLLLEQTTRQ